MENTVQETGLLIDYKEMPAYKGAKEKQEALLTHNPFIEITDNKSYEVAKQNRTALRQGRYDLQNGEKTIASKLKDFRDFIKNETAKLIGITLGAEEKQQAEIDRYEVEKQKEKEAALEAERKRKEALRQQVYDFQANKSKAIESATLVTIKPVITDITDTDLQLEEFTADFLTAKNRLISEAQKKQSQLQEDERLRVEREKADEERKKLDEERKKLEADKKKQEQEQKKQDHRRTLLFNLGLNWDGQTFIFEDINFHWTDVLTMTDEAFNKAYEGAKARKKQIDDAIQKQKEEEEAKIKKAKEDEEAKLKAEREKLEAEKTEMARLEKERQEKEEAERKEKHAFMVNQRNERIKALGLEYVPEKKELKYNGRAIWLNFSIDDVDDGTFTHETLPQVQTALENEKKRIELTKSDKQKLTESFNAFKPSEQFAVELKNEGAKVLISDFIIAVEQLKSDYVKLIDEL